MRLLLLVVCFELLIYCAVAPPVTEKKKTEHHEPVDVDNVMDVEYKRYLEEVVQLLEGDEDFKQKIKNATPEEIKSGDIAEHVDGLHHGLRTKLDELKRQELERLRHLAMQQYEYDNHIDSKHLKIAQHLDTSNPHTFEIEDLRKLILHTTKELEAADQQRKNEFKEYEMQKELTYQEQLKHLDEQNRIAAQKQHEEMIAKHNKHDPIHHPGSKDQYEQVWEEQDHMSADNFNPKTFFHLHDLDGNGFWDPVEVKALFKKELDKMYDPNAPEDDLRERFEEMERMREHVFNETDSNRDQLISYQEFLEQTKKKEFEEDKPWEPIDQQHHPVYSDDEYKQYERMHAEEIQRMIEQGHIPAAPPGYVPVVIPPDQHHMYQQMGSHPGGVNPPPMMGQGYHPNAIPQGHGNAPPQYHNEIPQQQGHGGQFQPHQQQQYQPPQQQQYQPPQQQQYQTPPQQQQQYQAPPQQQQYQAPPQQQQYQAPPQQQHQAPPQQQQNQPPQQQQQPPQQQAPPQQQHQDTPPQQSQQQTGSVNNQPSSDQHAPSQTGHH